MNSKLRNTGYFQVDHRDSPGLTNEEIHTLGSPLPFNSGRSNFEADVVTCRHCQTMVILNPLRTRPRPPMCSGCGRYVCDKCYLVYKITGVCKTFLQVVEEIQEAAVKAEFVKEI